MTDRVVYFNGEYVPELEARVSIFDSALMFGDMAFEMTRTFGGRTFRLRDHLERLYMSLRFLEIDCGLSIDEMERLTHETLERNRPTEAADMDWQIMHDVSRGPLAIYAAAFEDDRGPTVSINCWPLITHMAGFAQKFDSGADLVVPAQHALPATLLDAKAKTRSRMHYQLATLQAARMGDGCWPVLVDPDGFIAEGTGFNILLVKDGALLSPEPRNILRGISRATTMELAEGLKISVREANLDRYDALTADEIICTTTGYCILHARSFEGQPIGDGRAGPVTQRLVDAWKQHVGIDFVAQARDYAERLADWKKNDRS